MAATHPYTGKLSYSTDNVTYTDFSSIISVKAPDLTKGDTDITVLSSTGEAKEYMAGWRESGEVGLTLQFLAAIMTTVMGFYQSNTNYYWKVSCPLIAAETLPSRIVSFGFLKSISLSEMKAGEDNVVSIPITIKCSGPVTYTAAT